MILELENIAKVRRALIALDGISVIAGDNATGKSTISRALRAMCSLNANMSKLVQFERVRELSKKLSSLAAEQKLNLDVWHEPLPYRINGWVELLDAQVWSSFAHFLGWVGKYFISRKHGVERLGWYYSDSKEQNQELLPIFEGMSAKATEIMGIPYSEYARHVCDSLLNNVYRDEWRNIVGDSYKISLVNSAGEAWYVKSSDAEGTRSMSCEFSKSDICSSILYIEPFHVLDFLSEAWTFCADRYMAGEGDTIQMLRKRPSAHPTLDERKDAEVARGILEKIAALIKGSLCYNDDKIVFEDREDASNPRKISVASMASGAKTMAAVMKAIENGTLKKGGLLVIDEPESSLHPAWQVDFAKFIVLLNREYDVRVLMTTHSPYFFKAIKVHADFAGVGENCHYYQMRGEKDCQGYVSEECTKDARPVFESLMLPYAKLKFGENYELGKDRKDS